MLQFFHLKQLLRDLLNRPWRKAERIYGIAPAELPTLGRNQFQQRLEAADPGATLGVSVGRPLKGGNDRVSLAGPHDPVPTAMRNLLLSEEGGQVMKETYGIPQARETDTDN